MVVEYNEDNTVTTWRPITSEEEAVIEAAIAWHGHPDTVEGVSFECCEHGDLFRAVDALIKAREESTVIESLK